MDNKYQIIHIVSEVVVLAGLFFYINTKNKKLINRINELTQRLEEQEDIIQKHENMLLKLISVVDDLNNNLNQPVDNNLNKMSNTIKKKHKNDLNKVVTPKKHIIINIDSQVKPGNKVPENHKDDKNEEDDELDKKLGNIYIKEKQKVFNEETDDEVDDDENLDEELEEELEKVMDEELEEELKDLE